MSALQKLEIEFPTLEQESFGNERSTFDFFPKNNSSESTSTWTAIREHKNGFIGEPFSRIFLNTATVPHEEEEIKPTVLFTPQTNQRGNFIAIKKWQGKVVDIAEESFTARLLDLNGDTSNEEDEAEIPIEEISPSDLELLSLGSIFYWNLGYTDSPTGQRTRGSEIRFRRLPVWSEAEIKLSEDDAIRLRDKLGWK